MTDVLDAFRQLARYAVEEGISEKALVRVVRSEARALVPALVLVHNRSAYTHRGCRCSRCREANRTWVAERRRQQAA